MRESIKTTHELPAGLAWQNSLATIDTVAMVAAARGRFKDLLQERPDDLELRQRVQGYFEEAIVGLSGTEGSGDTLKALGTFEDLLEESRS